MMDKEFKREIMMDHYTHPRNKRSASGPEYLSLHNASESCIDDVTVFMKIDNNVIIDVCFDGVGCTICTASTDIMCDLIKGKSLNDAKDIIQNYYNMVDEKEYDDQMLEEANAFDTLYQQANRIKCGTIGIHAMSDLIKEYEKR